MIGYVGQKVCLRLAEDRDPPTVSLRQDHLIEKHDARVVGRFAFSLVDEFVKAYISISIPRYGKLTRIACPVFVATSARSWRSHEADFEGIRP